ncbi:DUF1190 domain-containing protein [Buttiauxella agrestis]|uniref:DUF1190 domain-containing protein n=1 Tax=Buttiauxella agrestis TaxID=82977 RepID=UPI00090779EB|nr:DUF1190 domain-containing protein [Buttiauxella agrestis]
MSRKKLTRNKAIAPILTKSTAKRKGPRFLTLAIMGGAALLILKGCDDDEVGDKVYSTPYECLNDGHSSEVCNAAYDDAKIEFHNQSPKNLAQSDCEQQYGSGSCHFESSANGFIPAFAGFMLGQALASNSRQDCRYVSEYCNNYTSRPVWGGSSGYYSYSSSSGKGYSDDGHSTRPTKITTVSRGGYGKSSSARGSWGG